MQQTPGTSLTQSDKMMSRFVNEWFKRQTMEDLIQQAWDSSAATSNSTPNAKAQSAAMLAYLHALASAQLPVQTEQPGASSGRSVQEGMMRPGPKALLPQVAAPAHPFPRAFKGKLEHMCNFLANAVNGLWQRLDTVYSKLPAEGSDKSVDEMVLSAAEAECARIGHELVSLDAFQRQGMQALASVSRQFDEVKCPGSMPARPAAVSVHLEERCPYQAAIKQMVSKLVNLGAVLCGLGNVHARIREVRSMGTAAGDAEWTAPEEFNRKCTKYWVHSRNLMQVKCAIAKHLPVLVYGKKAGATPASIREEQWHDTAPITSVYFDNTSLDTYHTRLSREDGATLVRLRWYGTLEADGEQQMFVERKVHRESWTGFQSVKSRAPLRQKHVSAYFSGQGGPPEMTDPENTSNKVTLLREVQHHLLSTQHVPHVRTAYNRVAFQESSNNDVRVSIDQNLMLVKETDTEVMRVLQSILQQQQQQPEGHSDEERGGSSARGGSSQWRCLEFPYAVLEVKLATPDTPEWIKELMGSGLLLEVPKFSKFLHGMAMLYPASIQFTPHWFAPLASGAMAPVSMEDYAALGLAPPSKANKDQEAADNPAPDSAPAMLQCLAQMLVQAPASGSATSAVAASAFASATATAAAAAAAPPAEAGSTQAPLQAQSSIAEAAQKVAAAAAAEAAGNGDCVLLIRSNGKDGQDKADAKPRQGRSRRRSGRWTVMPWGTPSRTRRMSKGPGSNVGPDGLPRVSAMLRTRVEPKTFFANERTFLAWLQIAVLVMFTALSLLGGSSGSTVMTGGVAAPSSTGSQASQISGAVIAPVGMLLMLYALWQYRFRTRSIANRNTVRWDDQWGPLMLTVLLIGAMLLSYILAINSLAAH